MIGYRDRVVLEIGKIKGKNGRLWELSRKRILNRDSCKRLVLEIRKSLKVLWGLIEDFTMNKISDLELEKYFLFTVMAGKPPEVLMKDVFRNFPLESDISSVIYRLDNPDTYKDEAVRDYISTMVEKLEVELTKLENRLGIKYGLSKVQEFLSTFPEFTDNWAVVACYLTALEIMVNRRLGKLGLKRQASFKDNYSQLLRKLKEKSVEVSELEKHLPSVLWDIRNKVIHEGYSPNQEDIETITKYVEKVLTTLTIST